MSTTPDQRLVEATPTWRVPAVGSRRGRDDPQGGRACGRFRLVEHGAACRRVRARLRGVFGRPARPGGRERHGGAPARPCRDRLRTRRRGHPAVAQLCRGREHHRARPAPRRCSATCGARRSQPRPADVEAAITPATKALLALHYGGYPCAMEECSPSRSSHGLCASRTRRMLPGDLARSCVRNDRGRRLFQLLLEQESCDREGGMIVTDDDRLAEKAAAAAFARDDVAHVGPAPGPCLELEYSSSSATTSGSTRFGPRSGSSSWGGSSLRMHGGERRRALPRRARRQEGDHDPLRSERRADDRVPSPLRRGASRGLRARRGTRGSR